VTWSGKPGEIEAVWMTNDPPSMLAGLSDL